MNQNLSWEIQLALAAVIGLVIGLLVMWLMMRTSRSKEKEHEELDAEIPELPSRK